MARPVVCNKELTAERLLVARTANITDQEIMDWVPVGYEKLKKAKTGTRGFLPRELNRLNELIAIRTSTAQPTPPQPLLNFESTVAIDTAPNSPFDLRVLKVTNELVWMVELRPKGSLH